MIIDKIKQDYINALKNKEEVKVNTLRLLVSEIKNKEIELRTSQQDMNDEVVLSVLQKEVKKRKESSLIFSQSNRQDLADAENAEIAVIEQYLPQQMSIEDIEKEIIAIKNQSEVNDFNSLIKIVMSALRGKADGKVISEVVKKITQQ